MRQRAEKSFNYKITPELSPMEEKIIILLCEDKSITVIAKRLECSTNAIHANLNNARKRNKVKTNYGLIVRYLATGYLSEFKL